MRVNIDSHKMEQVSYNYTIGIDEVGRGPLAGPVVVAGVKIISKIKNKKSKFWKSFEKIKDSKKLSKKRREEWFQLLTAHPNIKWAVARVWPRVIDRINISKAANLGAHRVYQKLIIQVTSGRLLLVSRKNRCRMMLDGGLHLPNPIIHETIVKGDERIPHIAAASIIAKVTRDRIMLRLHKKYPQYRFDLHKGYGTRLHRELIQKFGRSDLHRKSFSMPGF